jgi:hypothetical protein
VHLGIAETRVEMRSFPEIPGQRGLATTSQLLAAGWTESALRHLVRHDGRRVLPTVYIDHRGALDEESRLVASALWAGPGAILTAGHALALHGVPLAWTPTRAHFLVNKTRNRRQLPQALTVRTDRACPTRTLHGIVVAGLERALTDTGLLRATDPARLRSAALAALQSRLTSPTRLAAELASGRRNGSAPVRAGLADYRAGLWSAAEARLQRVLSRRPWLEVLHNPRIETEIGCLIGVPDAYLPRFGVAIQVHSREHHGTVSADGNDPWEATVEVDSLFVAAGIAVVGVAPTTLRDRPQRFLARLDATLATRVGLPEPRVRVLAHHVWNPGVVATG